MPAHSSGQRRYRRQIQLLGNMKHECFFHDDRLGIPAVGHPSKMCVLTVVGEYWTVFAILLESCMATGTGPAGIHHATDRSQITFLEFLDLATDPGHAPHDFVARHARVNCIMPLVANVVQIRMTDATIKDFNLHIANPDVTASNCERTQRRRGALRRVGFYASGVVIVTAVGAPKTWSCSGQASTA